MSAGLCTRLSKAATNNSFSCQDLTTGVDWRPSPLQRTLCGNKACLFNGPFTYCCHCLWGSRKAQHTPGLLRERHLQQRPGESHRVPAGTRSASPSSRSTTPRIRQVTERVGQEAVWYASLGHSARGHSLQISVYSLQLARSLEQMSPSVAYILS